MKSALNEAERRLLTTQIASLYTFETSRRLRTNKRPKRLLELQRIGLQRLGERPKAYRVGI
jgi:hypothetical protein